MISNELPAELGLYYWREYESLPWQKLRISQTNTDRPIIVTRVHDGESGLIQFMSCSDYHHLHMDYWRDNPIPIGQWLRIPGPDEIMEMQARLADLESIMRNSEGVAGWHKNGDIATWGEFPELEATDND